MQQDAGVVLPEAYRSVLADYPQKLIDLASVYPMKKGPPQRDGPENTGLYMTEELLRMANVADREYRFEIFPSRFL